MSWCLRQGNFSRNVNLPRSRSRFARIKFSSRPERHCHGCNDDSSKIPQAQAKVPRFQAHAVQRHEELSKYSYWKVRYKEKNSESFEWFLKPDEIVESMLNNIGKIQDSRNNLLLQYLDLGCGLSDLTLRMMTHETQPMSAVLVDFVSEALQYQAKRFMEYKNHGLVGPGSTQHLVCADVTSLPLRDNAFTVIVDKGTMDALMKDRIQGQKKCSVMLSEVCRLLADGGRYLQVSDEDPDTRLLFLEKFSRVCSSNADERKQTKLLPWKFECVPSSLGYEYFLYWTEKSKSCNK